jgi:hypothetical protein
MRNPLKHYVYRVEFLLKDPGISLFPYQPVHQNRHGIEVTSQRLRCQFLRCQPPCLRVLEGIARDWEFCLSPRTEPMPHPPGKMTVDEEMRAILIGSLT